MSDERAWHAPRRTEPEWPERTMVASYEERGEGLAKYTLDITSSCGQTFAPPAVQRWLALSQLDSAVHRRERDARSARAADMHRQMMRIDASAHRHRIVALQLPVDGGHRHVGAEIIR